MRTPKRRFIVPTLVLAGTLLLFRFVLFVGYVPTESMEPTLHKGSFIVCTRIFKELEVGDIVVFRHDGKLLVKRIAAVCGDVVEHNGKPLTVSDDEFYMLGDNKENSHDSRSWEEPFVEKYDVVAVLIVGRDTLGKTTKNHGPVGYEIQRNDKHLL